jgi:hypothetical protein
MALRKIPFWWLLLAAMTLNILVQAIHEGGHWTVYQISGHRPVWAFTSIVQVWDTPPRDLTGWVATTAPDGEKGWLKLSSSPGKIVQALDDAAGPLASLVSVIAGLLFYRFAKKPALRANGLVLTIITGLLMTFYYARSGTHVGDEDFLAASLGVPKLIFAIPLGLAFFTCLVLGLRELRSWKNGLKWVGTILLGMIPTAGVMVVSDPFIRRGVEAGNPLYQSILGFSLPVFLFYCLAAGGLILLGRKLNQMEKWISNGKANAA